MCRCFTNAVGLVAAFRLVLTVLFVQIVFLLDALVRGVVGYETGPSSLLPITAILRPLKLVSMSASMRGAVKNFVVTLLHARKVRIYTNNGRHGE